MFLTILLRIVSLTECKHILLGVYCLPALQLSGSQIFLRKEPLPVLSIVHFLTDV